MSHGIDRHDARTVHTATRSLKHSQIDVHVIHACSPAVSHRVHSVAIDLAVGAASADDSYTDATATEYTEK